MPMPMPIEAAWEKLVRERVDTTADLVTLTKADIESVTGNELRLMTKIDHSAELPKALQRHGYFILPVKNGDYVLVRGNGYHTLEKLPEPPTIFRPQLDFELVSLNIGDSEPQHLNYAYNIGLLERFANTNGLRQTIHGRKRMPSIEFSVGNIGPIHVKAGVQVEVDLGCEGRTDIVLIEAKVGKPEDFIVRQLYYPYRKWRLEIPQKRIRPWFFCSSEVFGKRLYKIWEYQFTNEDQYLSLEFKRGESFLVEPQKKRLTVAELLNKHVASQRRLQKWKVPQADAFWRVAEMPLLVEQGINTSAKVAVHYGFNRRQSSYYREAAEILGLLHLNSKTHIYELTDLGREYVNRAADERRELLAGLLAHLPPVRAALELSTHSNISEVRRQDVASLIQKNATISRTTPGRRATTVLAWLRWLQQATGAVQMTELGFAIR